MKPSTAYVTLGLVNVIVGSVIHLDSIIWVGLGCFLMSKLSDIEDAIKNK